MTQNYDHSLILDEIALQARKHVQTGGIFKAVFDLDSTIFDVNPRVLKILNQFAADNAANNKYSSALHTLSKTDLNLKNTYKLKDQIQHLGLIHEPKEFYADLLEYWKLHFFGHDFLKYDLPYEGAVEYVQHLYEQGAHIYYLTGRDVERMGRGTEDQLRQWNLPLGERGTLALKPYKEMDDAEFKRDFLKDLPRENVEVWFFENEPVNIDLVLREVNHVKVVYFESVHMEKLPPPGPEVPKISNFRKTFTKK